MAENNQPSLADIVAALPSLTKDEVEKLYSVVVDEGRKKGCSFARRFSSSAGSRRPR
jgi:hypothetical protein